jgi:hypothetical protein
MGLAAAAAGGGPAGVMPASVVANSALLLHLHSGQLL